MSALPANTARAASRAARTLVVAALAVLLAATSTAPAEAQTDRADRPTDRVTDVRVRAREPVRDVPRPDVVEELRFACRPDIVQGHRGVLCRWSESSRDDVRAYQLYRIVNGSARELVATVPVGDRLAAFDRDIEAGDHIVYGVVARNVVGRVIGIGGPARVAIPS